MTKTLDLGNGINAFIDDDDLEKCSAFRWRIHTGACGLQYAEARVGHGILLHRFLLDLKDRNQLVDHIDGNGLNCVRSNMRITDDVGNGMNKRKRVDSKQPYKGIYPGKRYGWQAQLMANGKRYYAYGRTAEEAARKYDDLARIHHGEYARLNFPDVGDQGADR